MGHRQKGKGHKRKRSWHRLRNQDKKYQYAMRKLERATKGNNVNKYVKQRREDAKYR